MVVFGNHKYACLSCIRGHRSSACEHRDRILLQIRKPGRKPQAEPQGRFALVRKDSANSAAACMQNNSKGCAGPGPKVGKKFSESEYKLVRVPSTQDSQEDSNAFNIDGSPEENENNDVVLTERYIFVHVGDNLFRRELRPEIAAAETQKRCSVTDLPSKNEDVKPVSASKPPTGDPFLSALSGALNNTNTLHDPPPHTYSPRELSPHTALRTESTPPLVIGPMQYQNDFTNRQASILHDLGISQEEATALWPDDPTSFSFASQCILPGQCQCGDGCECPDCHEHHRQH